MIFKCSHGFLSIIFGFLRKFWVGVVKNIFSRNIFSRRNFFRKDIEKYFSRPKIFENFAYEKTMKNENFKKLIFFEENNFFRFFFEKNISHRKNKDFPKIFSFYVFIVSHVQPLRVASRNSHCAARGRRKRPPENPKNPENPPNGLRG